jgi:hypothetical protein
VRAPTTILSITALLWGFAQAPFFHIHPEEFDHPASAPAHLHFHLAPATPGPGIDHTDNDEAIDVEWGIAPPSAAALLLEPAISEALNNVPSPPMAGAVVIPQPRGHDPPDLTPRHPRPPPA